MYIKKKKKTSPPINCIVNERHKMEKKGKLYIMLNIKISGWIKQYGRQPRHYIYNILCVQYKHINKNIVYFA